MTIESFNQHGADQAGRQQRAHVVALRRDGAVVSFQLRRGHGGPGQTRAYSVSKHGSEEKALRALRRDAREQGLVLNHTCGGSWLGRCNRLSQTSAAGIRFVWRAYAETVVLTVVPTWQDAAGRARHSSWSTAKHGLSGALDRAIAARVKRGAPLPPRAVLLAELEREYTTRA